MRTYHNVLHMIGKTPVLELKNLDTGLCQLFLKLEYYNPAGSVKDRIAFFMVDAAERSGELKPGGTLVEATAGNTGLGLALLAILKKYQLILVIPDKMSKEKISHLKAMGAKVIITRSDVNKGHPEYYQDMAERIAKETPNAFYVNQFGNPNNPLAHEMTTGPEIWEQMQHQLDAVVCGVGSGGTLTGIGRFMKKTAPHVQMILADPAGSILAEYVNHRKFITPERWLVEGIGEDFLPPASDITLAHQAYTVSDADSFATAREVLQKEGLFLGSSSGTLIHAALQYCREQTTPKRIITIASDSGNKYLSKMFNNEWMAEKGFISKTGATHDT